MCAQAAIDYLQGKGVECQMLDALECVTPILSQTVSRGFLLTTQYSRAAYSWVYRWTELKEEPSPRISVSRMTHTFLSKRLETYLDNFKPDVIVCTHVFSAQMLTQLMMNKKKSKRPKTIGIVTDFTIHPYWEDTVLDYYLIANELLANQFCKKNLPKEKILPFGIPIHKKFAKQISREDARAKLKFDDKRTVLLMSGSMGFGNVTKSIRQLDRLDLDFQIVTVCGNNRRLKKHVAAMKTRKKLYNYGFTDKIDLLMSAADCIVTKPGGLTTSEALAKGLVLIVSSTIPGQEERNIEFLMNNGLAMRATRTFPLDECIFQLFGNSGRLEKSAELTRALAKPNAAADLGDFILQIS
jgi:processive 1,2-diacylglycerol beta-glucosyltransferase